MCGGVVGKSLIDMVQVHCGKEAVYTIDLKDFYPSISSRRIFIFFLNSKCSPEIADILTKLVTYDDQLPQGFPTSTMLANLVAYKMDIEQLSICKKFSIIRTRWIDDIVFSGRIKILELAAPKCDCAVKHNGFKLNESKRNFSIRRNTPKVVGLSVNKHKPYIPEGVVGKIKEILITAKIHGPQVAQSINEVDIGKKDFKAHILGKINYIANYNRSDGIELEQLFKEINWLS